MLCFARLCSITAAAAAEQGELIETSVAEVYSMLREDVSEETNTLPLVMLCGALCCYKYTVMRLLGEVESIQTPDLTIRTTNAKALENAVRIRDDAIISAKHLLLDDRFFFGRMV